MATLLRGQNGVEEANTRRTRTIVRVSGPDGRGPRLRAGLWPKRRGERVGSIIQPGRTAVREEIRQNSSLCSATRPHQSHTARRPSNAFHGKLIDSTDGRREGTRSAGYSNDLGQAPRLQCILRQHATDRTIGRNAGNPSTSAAEAVVASSSRAAMSGSRARHQQWSRAFLMGFRLTGSRDTALVPQRDSGSLASAVVESRHPPESGIDVSDQQFSNTCVRLVHPITSQPLPTPRYQPARRMSAPSRLPSIYPTQASAWRRLLRVLGLDR